MNADDLNAGGGEPAGDPGGASIPIALGGRPAERLLKGVAQASAGKVSERALIAE